MKKRFLSLALLSSSVFGVVLAMPAHAQQTTTTDEVRELRAAVKALQARLDKIDSEQKVKAAPLAATAATPAAVTASTSAAPVEVLSTSVPTGWFANTTVGGKAFINLSSINQKSDGKDTAQNGVQTDVKRFYLTVDHKFDNVFSSNLTTDFRYGSNGLSNDTAIFVKKAYLQATLSPAFYVRIGAADLPWVPFVENVYGYRFVENSLIDRTKYGTSADYGVHIGGTLGNGLISYAVSAIDGLGFKTRARSSNMLDIEARLSAQPIKGTILAIGGYTGKLGKSNDTLPETNHRATRLDGLAAYSTHGINVGVEYFRATDWNNVTTVLSDRSDGWSTFGSYAFMPKVSVFGRYDWVHPNQRTNPALHENYFNAGVDFQPIKNIDIAAVYKRDKADNGLISTSNGTIGGAIGGTYDEFGIFTQLKF